ncbi:MAG: methyl-accepting chemotaxis protein [Acetivibrionales bacterium]|jgi:methyl-accepting chemotaxis protein
MKWFYNLKISTKLVIGFLIVSCIAAAVGIVALINISNIVEADTLLYERNTLGIKYSGNANTYYQTLRYSAIEMALLKDYSLKEEYIDKLNTYIATIDDQLANYEAGIITEEERQLFNELMPLWVQYKSHMQYAIGYAEKDEYQKVQSELLGNANAVGNSLEESLTKLTEYNDKAAEERAERNSRLAQTTIYLMVIIAGAGIIIAVLLAIFISRIISKPITRIVMDADKLAMGDIDIQSTINTKDEIGKLAESFRNLVASTREQALVAEKIAGADLTVDVTVRSEKDLLGENLKNLVNGLNEIIHNIASASEQVAAGSKQISDSSTALSLGATEQASSIEELTASIEEISTQTKLNAQNANKANELAEQAKSNALEGNAQMKEMLKAMEEIQEASTNISKVIKVIDDIAFQTNMLALNAAVEAARAGQHGKGFAVVAEEVKNLATRSASAARETTEMIEGSIKKSEIGTKIAKDTAEALNNIVDEIENVAGLINEIAVASNEQDAGIAQINQGIMLVSEVVQNNTATSEEGAAASEELSSQAELLRDLVKNFKLKSTKTNSNHEERNPEVLKLLDDMSQNSKKIKHDNEESEELGNENKISLSDREFGKY